MCSKYVPQYKTDRYIGEAKVVDVHNFQVLSLVTNIKMVETRFIYSTYVRLLRAGNDMASYRTMEPED